MRAATAKILVRGVLLAGLVAAMSGCVYVPPPAPYAYAPYNGSPYGYGYGYPAYYGGYYYGGPAIGFGYYGGGYRHWR